MEDFCDTSIPASSRAVRLVRLHHGIPEPLKGRGNAPCLSPSLRKRWRRESKANHLCSRRKAAELDGIAPESFPVILELMGGRNFVILKEREGNGDYLVQFPDGRESVVGREGLAEAYDGTCVFLRPARESGDDLALAR